MRKIILSIITGLTILLAFSCKETMPKKEQTKIKVSSPKEKVFLQEIYGEDYPNARINFSRPINLYGSSEELFFIETETSSESLINYTGRTQIITDKEGNVLLSLLGNEYFFKKIIENENPLLIITEITSKGNGRHHFYGMENNKLKNFLNTDGWGIQTIGRKSMQETFIPAQLNLSFEDINEDTFLDAVFSGELLHKPTNKKENISLEFIFDTKLKMFNLKK